MISTDLLYHTPILFYNINLANAENLLYNIEDNRRGRVNSRTHGLFSHTRIDITNYTKCKFCIIEGSEIGKEPDDAFSD